MSKVYELKRHVISSTNVRHSSMIFLLFGDEHLAIDSSTDIFNGVQQYTEKSGRFSK